MSITIGIAIAFCLAVALWYIKSAPRWLNDVPGPRSGSWLFGHQLEINRQNDVGELDFAWNRQYGGAWRIDDCFGGELLMVADPKAIHHILHVQGYGYPKTRQSKQFVALAFGRGVSWAADETHVRHRKVLGPAFNAQPIRAFLPVFRRVAAQLVQIWKDQLQDSDMSSAKLHDVNRGLTNATLDIIGETVFDYHFGSLDAVQQHNEFSDIFHNLFADSNLHPPPAAILFAATWAFIPESILRFVEYLPARQFVRFRRFLTVGKRVGKEMIEGKAAAYVASGKKSRNQDILSILVEANNSAGDNRLSEDEVLSQITTLLFAGHETTACTLTWLLYELAHHQEDQDAIREEITARRAKFAPGQEDFAVADLEALTFTNACIKEVLRFHPISPWVTRESAIHDIIPLSETIVTNSGKSISEIEIGPGVPVLVSTCTYNRLPSVWGPDAHKWNPRRFMNPELKNNQVPIGLHSNLLTFSAGPSGCIGFRFALLEMQSTIVELIENVKLTPPPGMEDIVMMRVPVGAIMAPMVKGKFDQRTQMPLGVEFLH
ncbi:cytochrome P450 [Mycena maculata]|uniref:Cytochrome P450 n=1 Tax=Mycena maculata TaxID=230809 RepID=A0AAD7IYU6_9AGAR|nr:cytochrome P450 [Mycena maculata]